MRYLVTANVNVSEDGMAMLVGYVQGHPVATVGYFTVEANSYTHAAEVMFAIGNREGTDLEGNAWPTDVRSLSVGDVLYVASDEGHQVLEVAPLGWMPVPQPTNQCQVPLAGTNATSRTI